MSRTATEEHCLRRIARRARFGRAIDAADCLMCLGLPAAIMVAALAPRCGTWTVGLAGALAAGMALAAIAVPRLLDRSLARAVRSLREPASVTTIVPLLGPTFGRQTQAAAVDKVAELLPAAMRLGLPLDDHARSLLCAELGDPATTFRPDFAVAALEFLSAIGYVDATETVERLDSCGSEEVRAAAHRCLVRLDQLRKYVETGGILVRPVGPRRWTRCCARRSPRRKSSC